jgi:hypothetical protein
MKKEFVSYDQAVALKKLGFDEQCFSFYDSDGELYESEGYYKKGYNVSDEEVIAPLKQQVFRWFREKYDLLSYIRKVGSNYWYNIDIEDGNEFEGRFDTYEEAEDACINRLIKISKQK